MGAWFEGFSLIVTDGKSLARPQKTIDGIEFLTRVYDLRIIDIHKESGTAIKAEELIEALIVWYCAFSTTQMPLAKKDRVVVFFLKRFSDCQFAGG